MKKPNVKTPDIERDRKTLQEDAILELRDLPDQPDRLDNVVAATKALKKAKRKK